MQNIFNRLVHVSTRLARQARRLIPSYGRSTRFGELSALRVDILGRIQIAVMVCATLWAIPFSNNEAETGQNVAAVMASLRGREEAVHKPQLPAVSLAFVFEHGSELTKTGIGDRLGETMVFDHPSHVQVFDADSVVLTHQISRHLIEVILSGVANVFLYPSNADALTVPPTTTFDATGENALGLGKTSLVFARMLRVGNPLVVAGCSQSIDSQVNANRFTGWVELGKFFIQDQRDEISPAGAFGNRDCRWVRLEFVAPAHVQSPQPTNNQIRIVGVGAGELEGRDRVFSALLVSLLLETRISCFLVEKLHEGVVQMSKGLLNRNAGDFTEPSCFLFPLPLGQFSGCLVVANALLPHLPRIRPISQCPVVGVATATEYLREFRFLRLGWIDSELVSDFHTNNIYV